MFKNLVLVAALGLAVSACSSRSDRFASYDSGRPQMAATDMGEQDGPPMQVAGGYGRRGGGNRGNCPEGYAPDPAGPKPCAKSVDYGEPRGYVPGMEPEVARCQLSGGEGAQKTRTVSLIDERGRKVIRVYRMECGRLDGEVPPK